jgi:hypothetical protein
VEDNDESFTSGSVYHHGDDDVDDEEDVPPRNPNELQNQSVGQLGQLVCDVIFCQPMLRHQIESMIVAEHAGQRLASHHCTLEQQAVTVLEVWCCHDGGQHAPVALRH